MTQPIRCWFAVVLLTLVGSLALPSRAQRPDNVTIGEVALLPEYCPFTPTFAQGTPERPSPAQAPWIAKLGPGFWVTQHYCWALIKASRAGAAGLPATARHHLLGRAVDDINTALRGSPPTFVLTPELYLRKGEYMERLGHFPEALESFSAARKTRPDYWPAYTRAAALLERIGSRGAALAILDEGLAADPGNPALTAARESIGTRRGSKQRHARSAAGATPE